MHFVGLKYAESFTCLTARYRRWENTWHNTSACTGQCRYPVPLSRGPETCCLSTGTSGLQTWVCIRGGGFGRLPAIMTDVYLSFPQSFPVTVISALQSPAVTICTTSLTSTNPTFCPHSVFICFVWISEQTAIISLYSIYWLVSITEMKCVYCAGSLSVT